MSQVAAALRRNWIPIGCATTAAIVGSKAYIYSQEQAEIEKAKIAAEAAKKEEENKDVIDLAKDWLYDLSESGNHFLNEHILENDEKNEGEVNAESEEETSIFDGLKSILNSTSTPTNGKEKEPEESPGIISLASSFTSLLTGELSEVEFDTMINTAQNLSQQGDVNETKSTFELINLFIDKQEEVKTQFLKSLGFIDLQSFDPAAMFYFLEKEDEKKNPSYKRRKHRYYDGVDVNVVNDLNDALHLAEISYLDSGEEIKKKLDSSPWELAYCQVESLPEQPSHYLAVKKGQSKWTRTLEVLIVVRGTKTVPDILTDALLENVEYRKGRAHAGILRSGHHLVEKHSKTMDDLLNLSNKSKVHLTLVGHSLGAGAASIAGMEFHKKDNFEVEVVGFGSPPILSKDLSEGTKDYITTVIADADVVPRMSAETIGNLMLDMMEFDWTPKANRDIKDALNEVRKSVGLLRDKDVGTVMSLVNSGFDSYVKPHIRGQSSERLDTVLYPPGSCIHFYRDGMSVSGSYVPCDFFDEIDVSRTMVEDHFMARGYRKIFLEVMREYMEDEHFRFVAKSEESQR